MVYDKKLADYIGASGNREQRVIRVALPNNTIENLKIKTTNRDILLSSTNVLGRCDLNANNGNVELSRLSVGKSFGAEVKNGSVRGTIVDSYDVFEMTTFVKKGKNNLPEQKTGGDKKLELNVNNSDIAVEFVS